jgi:hypothetical protein
MGEVSQLCHSIPRIKTKSPHGWILRQFSIPTRQRLQSRSGFLLEQSSASGRAIAVHFWTVPVVRHIERLNPNQCERVLAKVCAVLFLAEDTLLLGHSHVGFAVRTNSGAHLASNLKRFAIYLVFLERRRQS